MQSSLWQNKKGMSQWVCTPWWGWKHLDECSTPPLSYISLFIQQCGVRIAASLVIHKTWVTQRLYIEHRRRRRRRRWWRKWSGRKGRRTGHADEKARAGEGAGQCGSFLKRRRHRSRRVKAAHSAVYLHDEQTEIMRAARSCTYSEQAKKLSMSQNFSRSVEERK